MADAASAPSADEVPQVIAVSADSDPPAESLSVVTATSTNPSANAATHRNRAKNLKKRTIVVKYYFYKTATSKIYSCLEYFY